MQKISDVRLSERARELAEALREKNMTFGAAESCTGGLISKTMTDIAGVSDVFVGGVVSYANNVKSRALGVNEHTIKSLGAVSPDVAMQMAIGARRLLCADVVVAVTGIAGPGGGSAEKPVGLVYIAACFGDGRMICEKYNFDGSRGEIRNAVAERAMKTAIDIIKNKLS